MSEKLPKRALPRHSGAEDIVSRLRSGEDTAELNARHRRMSSKGGRVTAENRGKRKKEESALPDIIGTVRTPQEVYAADKRTFEGMRAREREERDERREITDEETGEIIPNPRFGELLDS